MIKGEEHVLGLEHTLHNSKVKFLDIGVTVQP